jgi:hypothetical protein
MQSHHTFHQHLRATDFAENPLIYPLKYFILGVLRGEKFQEDFLNNKGAPPKTRKGTPSNIGAS